MREHVLYTHEVFSFEMTVYNMEPLKSCCSQRLPGWSSRSLSLVSGKCL